MLLKIAISLVFFYLLLNLIAYFFANKIAFPAPDPSYNLSAPYELIDAPNGGKICTIFLKNPDAKYTIFFSHGNGEDLGEIASKLENLYKLGFSVFAYDYFGYGQSTKKSTDNNIEVCAEAAWQYLLKSQKLSESEVVVFGYSMGSAPSSYLAKEHSPRALILMGGFASAFQTQLPKNIFLWDMLNNAEKLKDVHCPILIFHGTKDSIVRYHNAKILLKNANAPTYFITIKGAGHYNIPTSAHDAFFDGVKNFVNTLDPNIKSDTNIRVKIKQM